MIKHLPELLEAGIISPETAERIRDYYTNNKNQQPNRLLLVFGILGALLSGLGIILIIAHNWDELSRPVKTIFAFLPLVAGQILCSYALWKKKDNNGWKEGSGTFLFFAVGSCLSLVSQIYHIPGNISTFLLTWILLCLPLVYLLNSSFVSLLCIVGISWYAIETGYWSNGNTSFYYWFLLPMILPHYYQLLKKHPYGNFTRFHHWFLALSLLIVLGTIAHTNEEWLFVAYISLFGIYSFLENFPLLKRAAVWGITGRLGTILLLLFLSFKWIWLEIAKADLSGSPEFIVAMLLSGVAGWFLFRKIKVEGIYRIEPFEMVPLLFLLLFFMGLYNPIIATVLVNILLLGLGLATMRKGRRTNHLGVLNFGLLIIAVLIICRFFDTNLSFIVRGILFVLVGAGFFIANIRLLKKRKEYEP